MELAACLVEALDIVEGIVAGIEVEGKSSAVEENSFVAAVDSSLVAEGSKEPAVAVVARGTCPLVALACRQLPLLISTIQMSWNGCEI